MKRLLAILTGASFFFLHGQTVAVSAGEGTFLSLSECVEIALDSSPQILYSRADINEKEYALKSARKDLYPSLYAQYGYQYTHDADSYGGLMGPEDYFSYSLTLQQPIFQGGSLVTGVALGKLNLELSKSAMDQTESEIILSVHKAYYNLLKARKFEEVAEQSLEERKSHLKDARAYFKAGLIPKNDMLQSEVQLANAEIELIRARNISTMAMAELNTLLNRPVGDEMELEDILKFEPSEIFWEVVEEQARNNRPELRQSEIAIEQADKSITLTRAPYLPSITASASYSKQGDSPAADDYPPGPTSEVKTAIATLEWQLWAWGQSRDEVAVARHNLKKAEESRSELLDSVILQARKAFLDIKESEYNIGVTEKAIEQAEEDFRINQSRYQAQLSTTTDVLDAQTRLSRAKINYFNALYNYRIALMQLAWATGTLTK